MGWLRGRGLTVDPPDPREPGTLRFLAGSDAERARELATTLSGAPCDAVWCGRGGSGSLRTLDAIDELQAWAAHARGSKTPRRIPGEAAIEAGGALAARPELPLVGLSDATALLIARAFGAGPRAAAVHGPVITQLPKLDEGSADALLTWLRAPDRLPSLRADGGGPTVAGVAEGPLIAGNLALLASCAGTPEAIVCDGAVLLIEEIGAPAYRVDRILAQLHRSGALRGLAGLALGTFVDCPEPELVSAVLAQWARRLQVPCAGWFPVGHGAACRPVALGVRYRLLADRGVLEPAQRLSEWLRAGAGA